MENITTLLDAYLPNEITNPNRRKLFEAWLINQYKTLHDDFGGDISISDEDNIANIMLNKVQKCIMKKVNLTRCINTSFGEIQNENHNNIEKNYEKMTIFLFQVVFLTIFGVLGCVGNASIVIMFGRIKKQLTFHRLMMMLSVCDTFLIGLSFFVFSLPYLNDYYGDSILGHIAPIVFPLAKTALTASVYSTLAIAVERYLIICHPFYVVNHRQPAKRYIIFIIIFSIVYNLPRFFSMTTFTCPSTNLESLYSGYNISNESTYNVTTIIKNGLNCTPGSAEVRPTKLRLNYYYYSVYLFWMDLCVMELLPIIVLLVLNTLVLKSFRTKLKKKLRSNSISVGTFSAGLIATNLLVNRRISSPKSRRKTTLTIEHIELGLAKLSLTIVFIFILCHSFKLIPNIYELFYGLSPAGELHSSWVRSVIHFSNFLIVLCCSSNFYVYCFTHLNIGTRTKRWSKNFYRYLTSGEKKQQRHLQTQRTNSN